MVRDNKDLFASLRAAIGNPEDKAWPIIVCEGYATGRTLHNLTGHTVAVAFNAGNLAAVAQSIREQNPHRTIYVAGDNDHGREGEIGPDGKPRINVGKVKAQAAANLVKGIAIIPRFDHANQKHLSDWNDLANADYNRADMQIRLGMELGRKRIAKAVARQENRGKEQVQERRREAQSMSR